MNRTDIKILYPYFKKYSLGLFIGSLMIVIVALFLMPIPFLTKYILDDVIPNKNIEFLFYIIVSIIIIQIAVSILRYIQAYIFYSINNKIVFFIRVDLLKHLNKIKYELLFRKGTGYYLSRVNDDTSRLRSVFVGTFVEMFKDVVSFIVSLVAIFYINWKISVFVCSLLPFFLLTSFYYSKRIRVASHNYFESNAKNLRNMEELLSSIKTIKLFNRYNFNILKYFKSSRVNLKHNLIYGNTTFKNSLFSGLFIGLLPIISIGYGAYEVINGDFTIGSLIAFNSFSGNLFGPANRLISANIGIQSAFVALNRINELFRLPTESLNKINKKFNNLEIKNMHFNYTNRNVLRNVSLEMNIGQKIGIVGNSGSGKTTLINILLGFLKIEHGTVLLNGKEYNGSHVLSVFREKIGIVEQEPFLFDDTIYNNISLGKAGVTKEEIYEAARKAYVNNFADKLPERLQTQVGINGNQLSVGQKQRIALARALLKKPQILILDEATSAVDQLSEKYIIETINNLPKDMLIIISAHRLSTIRNCDKIFVLRDGTVAETGSHSELLELEGEYSKLYYANA